MFFLAAEPLTDKITWQNGNKYTFRLRASTYMQVAMLMPDALAAKKKRWALVYPNFEYGQSAVAALQGDDEGGAAGRRDSSPSRRRRSARSMPARWCRRSTTPSPMRSSTCCSAPTSRKFVREGNTRGVFKDRIVVSLLSGEPEYLDPLKDEAPVGWIVTGYPWYEIKTPEHKTFLDAYQKKFNDYPRLGSVVGYVTMKSIAAGITKAGSTDTEKAGRRVQRPEGRQPVRPVHLSRQRPPGDDGRLCRQDRARRTARATMIDFKYVDGADGAAVATPR